MEPSTSVPALRKRAAWSLLEAHCQKIKGIHLRQLFAEDRGRGERLTVEAAGIHLDYSKNRITDETLELLLRLAGNLGCGSGSTPCSVATKSTSRKIARCSTWRCVRRGALRSS